MVRSSDLPAFAILERRPPLPFFSAANTGFASLPSPPYSTCGRIDEAIMAPSQPANQSAEEAGERIGETTKAPTHRTDQFAESSGRCISKLPAIGRGGISPDPLPARRAKADSFVDSRGALLVGRRAFLCVVVV